MGGRGAGEARPGHSDGQSLGSSPLRAESFGRRAIWAHDHRAGAGRRFPLFGSCRVSELGPAGNTLDDDAGNLVRQRGVIGESIVNDRTFPIAMATPLDLLKLNGAVAHVVNDEGARLIPARQFAPMERDRLSNREYHGIAFAGLKGNAGHFVELCRSLPVDLAHTPSATA